MLSARTPLKGPGPQATLSRRVSVTTRNIGAMSGSEELRAAMRRYPFGVAVATVDVEGTRLGLTLSSLVSLALEPPLVGISIGSQAAFHELLREAGGFAASLLAGDQVELAQHFARGVPPIAMWHGVAARNSDRGPLLDGAVGWLECELGAELAAGDHTFFLGRVERAERGSDKPPLLRLGGDYRSA